MQILSASFLLLILPLSLVLYWGLLRSNRSKLWFLLLLSYLFYFLADSRYILLLIGLSLLTYLVAGKRVYWIGILVNILAITTFKVWGASFGPLLAILDTIGLKFNPATLGLAVPLGLSYYVFKYISYLVDVHKNRYPASRDWLTFFVYGALFAEISAGPISIFSNISPQLNNLPERWNNQSSVNGLLHLAIGIGKKVLLVESLAPVLGMIIFKTEGPKSGLLNIWLLTFLQGLFLYLDFSSYSDIALGLGYLFGLTLPPNFDSPYLSKNPSQFWQRWHITLSTWFRIYVFSPLSRLLITRFGPNWRFVSQVIANLVTMTMVGLWHGFQSGFILWGVYHGVLLSIHAWSVQKHFRWVDTCISQAATLVAVFVGWVFFYSTSTVNLLAKLQSMIGLSGLGRINPIIREIPPNLYIPLLVIIPIAFSRYAEASALVQFNHQSKKLAVFAGILLAITLLLLGEPGDFAYVQF